LRNERYFSILQHWAFYKPAGNPTEFEILRFEKMEEPDVNDFHKHSFYEILWTERGERKQIIDYNEYEKLNVIFPIKQYNKCSLRKHYSVPSFSSELYKKRDLDIK